MQRARLKLVQDDEWWSNILCQFEAVLYRKSRSRISYFWDEEVDLSFVRLPDVKRLLAATGCDPKQLKTRMWVMMLSIALGLFHWSCEMLDYIRTRRHDLASVEIDSVTYDLMRHRIDVGRKVNNILGFCVVLSNI